MCAVVCASPSRPHPPSRYQVLLEEKGGKIRILPRPKCLNTFVADCRYIRRISIFFFFLQILSNRALNYFLKLIVNWKFRWFLKPGNFSLSFLFHLSLPAFYSSFTGEQPPRWQYNERHLQWNLFSLLFGVTSSLILINLLHSLEYK